MMDVYTYTSIFMYFVLFCGFLWEKIVTLFLGNTIPACIIVAFAHASSRIYIGFSRMSEGGGGFKRL